MVGKAKLGAVERPEGKVRFPGGCRRAAARGSRAGAVPTILGTNRDENKLFLAFTSPFVTRVFGVPVRLRDPESYDLHAEYQALLWKAEGADQPAAAMRRAQGPRSSPTASTGTRSRSSLWLDFARLLGAAHALEIPFRGREGTLPPWTAWDDSRPDAPRFMVLDTEADGGLRMSSESVTRDAVLARALADQRFASERARCAFFRELVPRSLDVSEYAALGGGACAACPLEEKAVGG